MLGEEVDRNRLTERLLVGVGRLIEAEFNAGLVEPLELNDGQRFVRFDDVSRLEISSYLATSDGGRGVPGDGLQLLDLALVRGVQALLTVRSQNDVVNCGVSLDLISTVRIHHSVAKEVDGQTGINSALARRHWSEFIEAQHV